MKRGPKHKDPLDVKFQSGIKITRWKLNDLRKISSETITPIAVLVDEAITKMYKLKRRDK